MRYLVLALALGASVVASAFDGAYRKTPYVGAIVASFEDGRVLFAENADAPCYQASCTKLMTARLVLKAIKAGDLKLTDKVIQSERSAAEKPSRLGIKVGESITIAEALAVLMVKSANDIAVAIAERLAGSVEKFVEQMNAEAASLQMYATVYVSPNGYPPPKDSSRGFDRSTASDQLKLALAILRENPEILEYTKLEKVMLPIVRNRYGDMVIMENHNNLLVKPGLRIKGVDGLKTGYHDTGGYSIVLTGKRGNKRAVVVVVGASTVKYRDSEAGRLMEDAFSALCW